MNPSIQERIELLKPKRAASTLNFLGRLLMDNREMSIWEHDTATLPWGARRWRRRALAFAREQIRPRAAQADLHPHDFDPKPLIGSKPRGKDFKRCSLPCPLAGPALRFTSEERPCR